MVVNSSTNLPPPSIGRFWRFSKYLVPLSWRTLNFRGVLPPREVATYDQMAERFPELVRFHQLGCDHDWGEFPFQTIRDGQSQPRTAHAEPPFNQRIVSLKQSSFVGRHCCVLGPNQTMVAEFGYYLPDDDPRNHKRLKQFDPRFLRARWLIDLRYRGRIPAPQKLSGTAVLLNNPWCHNYYHWMLEVAPRLMMVRQAGLEPDWFVVDCQSRYQRRALQLLGVPAERIIQPHCALHLAPDEILRPSHPGLRAWKQQASELIAAVQAELAGHDKQQMTLGTGQHLPRRIYISRKVAAHRKVANEAELVGLLAAAGFESCMFEQLDFAQQVNLMQQAEVVVAVHGAALANLIYAAPGTRVVEICPVNRYNTDCFPRISHKFGHQHVVVLTPSTRFRQNLSVNLADVAQALKWCGLGQAEGRGSQRAKVA